MRERVIAPDGQCRADRRFARRRRRPRRSRASRSCRASRPTHGSAVRARPDPTRSSAAASTARSIPPIRHNRIIQDLDLAPRNARGQVEYVATFALARPVDPAKASGVLIYQVVNRGNGDATPNAMATSSLVSGWQGDVVPTAANQTIAVPVARHADGSPDHRPGARAFLRTCPPGTTTMPIRLSSMGSGPPVYPPADLEQPAATLTVSTAESRDGVKRGSRSSCRDGLGVRRLPDDAVPRHARSDAALSEGRLRPGRRCTSSSTPRRIRSCSASDLPRRATSSRSSVTPRATPRARPIRSPGRSSTPWRSATRSPGTSSRRSSTSASTRTCRGAHGVGRRVPANRRAADADQLPLRAARRRRDALRAGQRAGACGGDVTRTRRAAAPEASLLDRCTATKTCPKVIEAFGSTRVLGTAHVAGPDRHRRRPRHSAAGQRAPLLLPGHDAWWWTRRLSVDAPGRAARAAARCRRIPIRKSIPRGR